MYSLSLLELCDAVLSHKQLVPFRLRNSMLA